MPFSLMNVSSQDLFDGVISDDSEDDFMPRSVDVSSGMITPSSSRSTPGLLYEHDNDITIRIRPDTPIPELLRTDIQNFTTSSTTSSANEDLVILSSDDEYDNSNLASTVSHVNNYQPITRRRSPTTLTQMYNTRSRQASRLSNSTSSSPNRPTTTGHNSRPLRNSLAAGKRKRSPFRTRPTGNAARRQQKRTIAGPSTRPPPEDSDSDVELLSISNSVGDITLAHINQLESDEALARHLQAMFDEALTPPAAATGRNGASDEYHVRRQRRPEPSSSNNTATTSRRGAGQRGRSNDDSISNRTRSADIIRANTDIFFQSDDDIVEPVEELFNDPRSFNAGRLRNVNNRIRRPRRTGRREHPFIESFFSDNDGHFYLPRAGRNGGNARSQFIPSLHYLLNSTQLFADDIIDLDFENFLDIADRVGEASNGLKPIEIEALTRTKFFSAGGQNNDTCAICMAEFIDSEKLTVLPCLHDFHTNCVGRWLQSKPTCPICRVNVRA